MAKTAAKRKTETDDRLPAVRGEGALPAHLRGKVTGGRGISTKAEDNLVPLVYILQAQSPQVLPRNPKYIKGAAASDIWLRNSRVEIVKGDEGMLFQPCYFLKDFVEWKPRDDGGGFIARHAAVPSDARRAEDPKNPNKVVWIRPSGNEVIETRNHFGFVVGGKYGLVGYPGLVLPYVIPMTGSGHTTSRAWMNLIRSFIVDGVEADSFARYYRLHTVQRSNAAGDWFGWEISDDGWVESEAAFMRGEQLYASMERGEKAAADYDEAAHDEGSSMSDRAARAGL